MLIAIGTSEIYNDGKKKHNSCALIVLLFGCLTSSGKYYMHLQDGHEL